MSFVPATDTTPVWNLSGPRVALGPDERRLLPTYREWQSDPLTLFLLGEHEAPSVEAVLQHYDAQVQRGETICFTIWRRDVDSPEPIGRAELRQVDLRNRSAEVWVLIGPTHLRGHGYGLAAVQLLLEFAGLHLGLHSLRARFHSGNPAAARLFAAVGFQPATRFAAALTLMSPDSSAPATYDLLTFDRLLGSPPPDETSSS